MNTKQLQNQYIQRRYRANPNVQPNNSRRPEKRNAKQRHQQVLADRHVLTFSKK